MTSNDERSTTTQGTKNGSTLSSTNGSTNGSTLAGPRGRHEMTTTLAALGREWAALIQSPEADRAVAEWAARCPELVGCNTLADVLGAIRADPDQVLGHLLAADKNGSELAGRVVLQTMLPKLIVMARQDTGAGFGDYLSQLWLRIRTYPLQRRPLRIAANLALDTLKSVKADQGGRTVAASVEVLERLQQAASTPPVDDLAARRVLRAARELGLVDDVTHAVLVSVYADGLSGRDAAARHQISHDLVRYRCSRGVRTLSAHREQLLAAA